MWRILLVGLLCLTSHVAYAVDTDGDGRLDLIDVPEFNANASGSVNYCCRAIQDLDGASLLKNATHVGLSYNQIKSIESGDFQGLGNLQLLFLDSNQIASIESGDFQGLGNLRELYLDVNHITNIESGGFQGLDNLQWLTLSANQVTGIESGDFQGLGNLRTLSLYGNQITSIEYGDFQGLGKLQWLELRSNQITSIESDDFAELGNLQFLGLINNQLTNIENGAFAWLGNLQFLSVAYNQVTSVENGDFQRLGNLRELYLDHNHINSIERGAFQGLNSLDTLSFLENSLTELNLTGASFASLRGCVQWRGSGFCVDTDEILSLVLDSATLSQASFGVIVGETSSIVEVSLVGLRFSDGNPDSFAQLLELASLDNVTVDAELFALYADEFNAFDALPGNVVAVVLPGDTNSDGAVNIEDLNNVRNHFGGAGLGDTNNDGTIDIVDLNNVRNFFGVTAAQAVPEPAAFVIAGVAMGLVALAAGSRKRRGRCV